MGKRLEKLKKAAQKTTTRLQETRKSVVTGFQRVQSIAEKLEKETGLTSMGDHIFGGYGAPKKPKKKKKTDETGQVTININIADHLLGRDQEKKKKKG